MGQLQPNLLTWIPYTHIGQRGPNGYIEKMWLDDEARNFISQSRAKTNYILDNARGIFSFLDISLPSFDSDELEFNGNGKVSLCRDEHDGVTLIEDTTDISFSFEVSKTHLRQGTSYGSYDEFNIEIGELALINYTGDQKLEIAILEKIWNKISDKIRSQHSHKNWDN